ncbi:MAG: hypothetical protein E6G96_02625 [Alphaproteobacteria bacterium]|jgi:hypothetical protein|nr:MAG: hypothetical protein E6G96_02625 [Alphaproteobacteria bacterium]
MPAAALDPYARYMSLHDEGAPIEHRSENSQQKSSVERLAHGRSDEFLRYMSLEPAPVDMAAFSKRVGEIVSRSVRGVAEGRRSQAQLLRRCES